MLNFIYYFEFILTKLQIILAKLSVFILQSFMYQCLTIFHLITHFMANLSLHS